ncbi:MAG: hypothetical protein ACRBC3_18350 [Burkholderiaceae bacterium]
MSPRKTYADAVWAATAWGIGYYIVREMTSGMSGSIGYAIVSGWWFTAYISAHLRINLATFFVLLLVTFILAMILWGVGSDLLYRDNSALSFEQASLIGAMQALVVASPVVFNWTVAKVISWIQNYRE